jgi:hypothetical protein
VATVSARHDITLLPLHLGTLAARETIDRHAEGFAKPIRGSRLGAILCAGRHAWPRK